MIRYYFIGSTAVAALLFLVGAYFYDRGWKRGKATGYQEGMSDGFKEGQASKEKDWWANAEKSVDEEKARLWRESGAA